MKKNEFIILFGLILIAFSIYSISNTIYTISWYDSNNYTYEWNNADILYLFWLVLMPMVVLVIGAAVRSTEGKQRDVPHQIAQQVSKVIGNMKFCTKCGNHNPKGAQFCLKCGEKFPII